MIGELDERISFMVPVTSKSSVTGEELKSFLTSSTVWANLNYLITGSEETKKQGRKNDVTKVTITTYYNSTVRPTWQIKQDSRQFEILSIFPDPDNLFMSMEVLSVKPWRNVYYMSSSEGFWTDPFGNYWVAIDRGDTQPTYGNLTWTNTEGDSWTTT